jgi:hypothetical protein
VVYLRRAPPLAIKTRSAALATDSGSFRARTADQGEDAVGTRVGRRKFSGLTGLYDPLGVAVFVEDPIARSTLTIMSEVAGAIEAGENCPPRRHHR